jgi:hypothetical protein
MRIEVRWRNGKTSIVDDVRPNRIYEIDEHFATSADPTPSSPIPPPFFKDVTARLGHTHVDALFDDFAKQPLLPRKLSQLGPGISWFDVNHDGHDDLIIGSGKGGHLALYLGDGQGQFKRHDAPPFNAPVTRDQTAILAWQKATNHVVVLTGAANYEDGLPLGAAVRQYDLRARTVDDPIPADQSSTGPLAMADIDGDGDLDLFVGGRVKAGRWPEPATSRIYRNDGGKLVFDTQRSALFKSIGLVTGAVFSDLDNDGFPELILACEWGPIRLFDNHKGTFIEVTEQWGLSPFIGWWNGIATGDFNGDGLLDIVASNWGLNSSYHATPEQPVQVFYTDSTGAGFFDLIEAEFDPATQIIGSRRMRDSLAASLPWIPERFPTHQSFAEASIQQMLGDQFNKAGVVEANTLASSIFLNRGDKFERLDLPREAQFTAAFGVVVADFDGDGNEDVVLSQNFFATEPGTPRQNAGRGLWLKGDGTGNFETISGQNSGVIIYGEQRGAAIADFNEDGRIDIAITQNGAATRLFENQQAKPGLRVRLQGPPANPHAVGAVIRLIFDERLGPAREIRAGTGYWSQDSPVQVMGLAAAPTAIWIRWPGGRVTTTPISEVPGEIRIGSDGSASHTPRQSR